MAEKKIVKKIGGPFLAAGFLCNSISEDNNGLLSAGQIIDEIRIAINPETPSDFPSKTNPVIFSTWVLIIIRRGDAPSGKHKLRLVMESPMGKREEKFKQDFVMPQFPNGGISIKAKLMLQLYTPGVFWIDVLVGKKCLTRIALNVLIQRGP
jgi:hypothetical protein